MQHSAAKREGIHEDGAMHKLGNCAEIDHIYSTSLDTFSHSMRRYVQTSSVGQKGKKYLQSDEIIYLECYLYTSVIIWPFTTRNMHSV